MPSNADHLLWKITHKDAPGKVSYLFGSIDKVSPTQQREITNKIIALDEFKNSPLVITDRDYLPFRGDQSLNSNSCKSVSEALAIKATLMGKELYPLDSDHYYNILHDEAKFEKFIRPSNLVKVGFFAATFPISLPFYFIYHEHHKHKLKEQTRDAFMNEDAQDILIRKFKHKGFQYWETLVEDRNYKWMNTGSDVVYPYSGVGLRDYLKHNSAFIVVPAANLFNREAGLITQFRRSGYVLEPVNWKECYHDHQNKTTQKITDAPMETNVHYHHLVPL